MKISILLPVFNSSQFLVQCLKSLSRQTCQDIEIIAVDDGSTDRSLSILHKYSTFDKRVKVLSQEHQGVATARNLALNAARGKYLMCCDSDDWYESNMCERMLYEIKSTGVDLVMCSAAMHALVSNNMSQDQARFGSNPLVGIYKIDDTLSRDINVLLWNKIFKSELIKRFHMTFPDRREHDDLSFVHQYLAVANTYCGIPDLLYNHRLRTNSIMDTFYRGLSPCNKYDILYAMEHTGWFLHQNGLWTKKRSLFYQNLASSVVWLWQFLDSRESEEKAICIIFSILKTIGNEIPEESKILSWIWKGQWRRTIVYLNSLVAVYRYSKKMVNTIFPQESYRRKVLKRWLS